jgi:hypothetical protein
MKPDFDSVFPQNGEKWGYWWCEAPPIPPFFSRWWGQIAQMRLPCASSLSESNPTSQFGAVFRAKVGCFSHILAKKRVKVGRFCGKMTLSDKLLAMGERSNRLYATV